MDLLAGPRTRQGEHPLRGEQRGAGAGRHHQVHPSGGHRHPEDDHAAEEQRARCPARAANGRRPGRPSRARSEQRPPRPERHLPGEGHRRRRPRRPPGHGAAAAAAARTLVIRGRSAPARPGRARRGACARCPGRGSARSAPVRPPAPPRCRARAAACARAATSSQLSSSARAGAATSRWSTTARVSSASRSTRSSWSRRGRSSASGRGARPRPRAAGAARRCLHPRRRGRARSPADPRPGTRAARAGRAPAAGRRGARPGVPGPAPWRRGRGERWWSPGRRRAERAAARRGRGARAPPPRHRRGGRPASPSSSSSGWTSEKVRAKEVPRWREHAPAIDERLAGVRSVGPQTADAQPAQRGLAQQPGCDDGRQLHAEHQVEQVVAGVERPQPDADGEDEVGAPGPGHPQGPGGAQPPRRTAADRSPQGHRGAGVRRTTSASSSAASSRAAAPCAPLRSATRWASDGTTSAETSRGDEVAAVPERVRLGGRHQREHCAGGGAALQPGCSRVAETSATAYCGHLGSTCASAARAWRRSTWSASSTGWSDSSGSRRPRETSSAASTSGDGWPSVSRTRKRSSWASGQRVGAGQVERVLGGDHQEGPRQRVGDAVHGDVAVAHRLEQGGLGAGRRAVELVGQHELSGRAGPAGTGSSPWRRRRPGRR